MQETLITKNIFSPRIRTGLLRMKGGLNMNDQCVRVGIMLPERKENGEVLRSKLYIASGMFTDEEQLEKPKEYFSFRMAELADINSFFIAYCLAAREFCRQENYDISYVADGFHKRVEACFRTGNYDAQIHSYGMRR